MKLKHSDHFLCDLLSGALNLNLSLIQQKYYGISCQPVNAPLVSGLCEPRSRCLQVLLEWCLSEKQAPELGISE